MQHSQKSTGFVPGRLGFSMVELVVVIGILSVLALIIITAVNPRKQLAQARDAQRRSDVLTIIGAFYQYVLDHGGTYPSEIPYGEESAKQICKTSDAVCNNGVNLRSLSGTYVAEIPFDPHAPETGTGTDYFIFSHSGNRITVFAPLAEHEEGIRASR